MLRKTTDSYRAEVLQKTGGAYVVTGEYVNRDTPIRFLHDIPTCGREFELTPKYFYKYTYPCPYCRKEQFHQNNIKAHAVFVAEVAERYGEEYTVLGTYRGSKASIELQHNSAACHFRVFRCTPNNFLRGHTCPACNQVGQSYPELCLLIAIQSVFPQAHKQKIQGRECDIVLQENELCVGIQYDGAYYHAHVAKDEQFNRLFLGKSSTRFLIRIREKGCPPLDRHARMRVVHVPGQYSLHSLNQMVREVLSILNELLKTDHSVTFTEKMAREAAYQAKLAGHYRRLLQEYTEYVQKHRELPKYRTEGDLRGRINRAIADHKFARAELEWIAQLQKEYGRKREKREATQIWSDVEAFFAQNGFLPRQQVSDPIERTLYQELKSCIHQNRLTSQQNKMYESRKKQSCHYTLSAEELVDQYCAFAQEHGRIPCTSSEEQAERSLAGKIYHRISRESLNKEQAERVRQIRENYGVRYRKIQTYRAYLEFIQEHDRLPLQASGGGEKKLEADMLYYLRNHRYEKAQRDKIISLRARYQPLNRQMRDAEHYGGESPQAFVERKYQEFYQIHQRFPVYDRSFPDEYQLCRLYLMFGGGRYPVVEKPRTEVNTQKARCTPRRKTPEETFAEAMAFYQEHGRMPLHRKKKPGQERAAEGKLAARVTALFRANRFSDEQMRILRKLRIQNVDKPRILLDKLLQYIREHDGNAPKHTSGIAENRLLNSIKNHIREGHYSKEQLDILQAHLHLRNTLDK